MNHSSSKGACSRLLKINPEVEIISLVKAYWTKPLISVEIFKKGLKVNNHQIQLTEED